MATVKQYVHELRERAVIIALKRDVDVRGADKQTRVLFLSILTILAVVVKVLVDKGFLTNAELAAGLDAARDDTYDREPTEPPGEPG